VGVLKAGPAPAILYAKWVVPSFFHVVLEGLEKEAREAKKGLWADPHPVPPWEWQKKGR
jgi:endonuclease YncB( thermonuclease family)